MVFGHRCKVKSRPAVKISKATYEHFQDVVECREFRDAMDIAHEQLNPQTHRMETLQYQEEFQLPLSRNAFGLLTIPVYVNHVLCRFIVDTGAQISGIKEKKAMAFHLPQTQGRLSVGSIGGTQKSMKGVEIDAFQFGAIEYRKKTMVQLNDQDFSLRFGTIDLLSFDGILGWDILSQLDFELDDIKKRFIVLKNRLKVPNPNMLKGSFPCFIVSLPDGKQALYGFDSGSKVSWLGDDAIQQQGYAIAGETTGLGFGVHGMERMHMKVVEHCTLYLDKAQIELIQTMNGRTHLFSSFTFDGILGNEIFKGRRMRIINSANMVLIA